MDFIDRKISIKSSLKKEQFIELETLTGEIIDSMPKPPDIAPNAMFKIPCGLYTLVTKDGSKDNGCIINTVMQITDNPKRIAIAVNKANYSHDLIIKTGEFNICILTEDVPFKVFEHFGFQSGKDVDKFAGCSGEERTSNGLRYLPKFTNAVISAKVTEAGDYGTHSLFIAEVTETLVLSDDPGVTYSFYFANIKPKPQPVKSSGGEGDKKGYICTICRYIYEGDTLPDDFICPLCKHGVADFEPL